MKRKGREERRQRGERKGEDRAPSYLIQSLYFTLIVTVPITCPTGDCWFVLLSTTISPWDWEEGWNGHRRKLTIFSTSTLPFLHLQQIPLLLCVSWCINISRDFPSLRVGDQHTCVTGFNQSVVKAEFPFFIFSSEMCTFDEEIAYELRCVNINRNKGSCLIYSKTDGFTCFDSLVVSIAFALRWEYLEKK